MKPIFPEPITFFVPGQPKAQPRPRLGKGGRVYNPPSADGWKTHIWAFGHGAIKNKLAGPVSVTLEFYFARPQDHFHHYKKADKGIPTKAAPAWHATKPDTDNIAKAVLDALTPSRSEKKFGRVNLEGQVESWGAWYDDCQVSELIVRKRYATDAGDGCQITIARIPENNDQH